MNVKPNKIKGTHKLNPVATANINHGVSCMRQYDVNVWFYTKGETTIAIDAGYRDYPKLNEKFDKLGINPNDVSAVF